MLALVGCARFDLDERIQLVPAASWTDDEVADLEVAAECWRLAFGIPFEVLDEPYAKQVVSVQYNELVCWRSEGRFTPGQHARIDVCREEHWRNPGSGTANSLLTILVHELGHAAGIRVEGHGPRSVMGGNVHFLYDSGGPAFSAEDEQLLADAAPGFVFDRTCEPEVASDIVRNGVYRTHCRCP